MVLVYFKEVNYIKLYFWFIILNKYDKTKHKQLSMKFNMIIENNK